MLMLLGVGTDLRNLGLRNLISEYTTDSLAPRMHLQHDPGGLLAVHRKNSLQHIYYKFHRRVVIVQQQYPVQGRPLDLGPRLFDCEPASIIRPPPEILVTRVIHC